VIRANYIFQKINKKVISFNYFRECPTKSVLSEADLALAKMPAFLINVIVETTLKNIKYQL